MDLPLSIKAKTEQLAQKIPLSALRLSVKNLTDRYRDKSGQGAPLAVTETEVLAYSAVRMPATYGAISSALKQTVCRLQTLPKTMLDVGAGTGAASIAAAELLPLTEVTLLEREPEMIRIAQMLVSDTPALQNARFIKTDITAEALSLCAELVIAAYALNELNEEKRLKTVGQLYSAAQSVLLLVEPGTPEGFRQLKSARNYLIKQGAEVIAPCPANGVCRLEDGDWCHFTVRVARGKLHKLLKEGDAPYEDEKFAYLAVGKAPATRCASRVLRHPIVQKGNIQLTLCAESGVCKQTVTKKDADAFRAARKVSAGEEFPFVSGRFAEE